MYISFCIMYTSFSTDILCLKSLWLRFRNLFEIWKGSFYCFNFICIWFIGNDWHDELNPSPLQRKLMWLMCAKIKNKKRSRFYPKKKKIAICSKIPFCLTLISTVFKYFVLIPFYNANFNFNLQLQMSLSHLLQMKLIDFFQHFKIYRNFKMNVECKNTVLRKYYFIK